MQYRLDDEEDFCDPHRPQIKGCPLLPSQQLNILDVPVEVVQRPTRSFSDTANISLTSIPMTLEPADRLTKVMKPRSKLLRYYASHDALCSRTTDRLAPQHQHSETSLHRSKFSRDAVDLDAIGTTSLLNSLQDAAPPSHAFRANSMLSDHRITHPIVLSRTTRHSASDPANSFSDDMSRPSTRHGDRPSSCGSFESLFDLTGDMPTKCGDRSLPPISLIDGLPSDELEEVSRIRNPVKLDRPQGLGIDIGLHSLYKTTPALSSTRRRDRIRPSYMENLPLLSPSLSPPKSHAAMDIVHSASDTDRLSPFSEALSFDLCSPTFTADTISTGGFDTPARLSNQFYEAPSSFGMHLQRDAASPRLTPKERHERNDEPFVLQSENGFPANSSRQMDKHRNASLADTIFGELGYLRRAIH